MIYNTNVGVGLLMEPGLGKTSTTLQICSNLKAMGKFKKALIIAPTRVCTSVWPKEAKRWAQFNRMRFEVLAGLTQQNRVAAFERGADFYCINPEGTEWAMQYLLDSKRINDFDTLIIDEVTKFKSPKSKRLKALSKAICQFQNRMILTGTPIPNSIEDIWGPVSILDFGARLGSTITQFRQRYCHPGGYMMHKFVGNKDSETQVRDAIKDICIYLSAKDHLDMPPLTEVDVEVEMPPDALKAYKLLESELVADLMTMDNESVNFQLTSAAAKYVACRQLANGGVYGPKDNLDFEPITPDKMRIVHQVHRAKSDAIREIQDELMGKPLLVAITYRHDYERLCETYKNKKLPVIWGGTSSKETDKLVDKWNNGDIPTLVAHPAAMGHGLNMQSGPCRDIAWMGLPDVPEYDIQMNARVWRLGVGGAIRVHRILANNTVDRMVVRRLTDKDAAQQSLLAGLRNALVKGFNRP